jgi:hypothetical protein
MATTTAPPPETKSKGSRDARMLAAISFTKAGTGTREVDAYADLARSVCRDLADEFRLSAAEMEAGIVRTLEGSFVDRYMAKRTAKKSVARLRTAAEHLEAAANQVGKFHTDYCTMWAQFINPDGRGWRFKRGSR